MPPIPDPAVIPRDVSLGLTNPEDEWQKQEMIPLRMVGITRLGAK